MKTALQFLIVACLVFFIWSCEKEVKLNRIEGTLSAGMDIGQNDLANIPVVMVKIYDSVNFNRAPMGAGCFEDFYSAITNAEGYYYFDSLPDGNYMVACGQGFKFADVDFVKISASRGSVNQVSKSVNRLASSNGIEDYELTVENNSPIRISSIEFFVNNSSLSSYDISLGAGKSKAFDVKLDELQDPTFRLACIKLDSMKQDSLFKSEDISFFKYKLWGAGFFDLLYSIEREQKVGYIARYEIYIKLKKGWWFGHYIELYQLKSLFNPLN